MVYRKNWMLVKRQKQKRGRDEKFPAHLPRYETIVDLPDDQEAAKTFLSYDEVETLEFERAKLRIRVTKYAKYVDSQQPKQGVLSPERPTGLVEGKPYEPIEPMNDVTPSTAAAPVALAAECWRARRRSRQPLLDACLSCTVTARRTRWHSLSRSLSHLNHRSCT